MKTLLCLLVSVITVQHVGSKPEASAKSNNNKGDLRDSIVKIDMHLSAFGVESDDFPTIDAHIDFIHGKSNCEKTFYDPKYKGSIYSLTKSEMQAILNLVKIPDLKNLQGKYEYNATDQPTSTTIVYTTKTRYMVVDYGLIAPQPLKDLYKIVYKY